MTVWEGASTDLHIPRKFYISGETPHVESAFLKYDTTKDALNEIFDVQAEVYRQNWLEIERWATDLKPTSYDPILIGNANDWFRLTANTPEFRWVSDYDEPVRQGETVWGATQYEAHHSMSAYENFEGYELSSYISESAASDSTQNRATLTLGGNRDAPGAEATQTFSSTLEARADDEGVIARQYMDATLGTGTYSHSAHVNANGDYHVQVVAGGPYVSPVSRRFYIGNMTDGVPRLGFCSKGASPAAQQAHIPDATDLTSAVTRFNQLLAALRAYGLIGTP